MNAAKQQELFAKRRDAEQLKIEKTTAVDKYYGKWDRITSRYEQWTTPEYYEQAAANFRQSQEAKRKSEQLEIRQNKLRELLKHEKDEWTTELKNLKLPKSRQIPVHVLQNIHENFQRTEEKKRRLDLECRLYKGWRSGFCTDSILLDSKSDNQTLAKMNWMDKQVAAQMERDRQKHCQEEHQLRMQEEARKQEELLLQQKVHRDEEIKELKSFQDRHVNEIKEQNENSQKLHEDENRLRKCQLNLTKELSLLEETSQKRRQRHPLNLYNSNRIKMQLRHRCTTIRDDLREDINMLIRIAAEYSSEQLDLTLEQFEKQYKLEIQKKLHIEGMFESEAKLLLMNEEQIWSNDAIEREKLMKQIILKLLNSCEKQIEHIVQRRRELIDIKKTHLNAIDNTNQRYKELLVEQQKDENRSIVPTSNLIGLHDISNAKNGANEMNRFVPSKFAKKKIAWT